ncbi:DNA polymerase III subunit delta [Suttonella sp. R2A3]|uniref:DNA polymerase III subunit delta n=1 Tax=Suttonella sp. R2A3 TaxID=2908648 RepID=UPI001F373D7A|nr:DNA polymerase III subunit delta [Suttonella sp. R2A3]UJF25404.1 DNA polymerase III subunit delta [Suttonella sp. R2A3]
MNIKAEQAPAYFQNVECPPITLIYGAEPLLNLEALHAAKQRAKDDGFSERQRLDSGSGFNWQQLGNEIDTPSLFSPKRLIELVIEDKNLNKKAADALSALSGHQFKHTRLIIYAPDLEKPESKAWVKNLFTKDNLVIQSQTLFPKAFAKQIEQRLHHAKLHLTESAYVRLMDYSQGNLLAGQQAIDRLAIHPQHKDIISAELLVDLLADMSQFGAFALSDALIMQNWLEAYHIACRLEAERNNEAVLITWSLHRDCTVMLQLKNAIPKDHESIFKQYRIFYQKKGITAKPQGIFPAGF